MVWESLNLNHNHDPDEENKLEHQIISNGLKTQDVKYIKHNMLQARASVRPKLPKNRQEEHDILQTMDVKTFDGKQFLQTNDVEKGVLLFSTEDNLKFLSKSSTIYIDGTFSFVHNFFTIFTLLNDKNQESYINIFQIINNYCLTFNNHFEIKKVNVDFEVAIHNAIHEVRPLSGIRGCRFHLGQSWYRTIQKLGLSMEYEQKTEIVGNCFSFELAEIQPNNDKVRKCMDYLVENYIDNNSLFPPLI
ncbi:hypothetical protein AGLY_003313 [Aphis glycines]|uniref:MULE transposase domain-containing protein n=1 Tax=Aphis glycines TaxID=307491 RepID=A0A6G0U2D7_APHGL|nr:hypothetical protein AGLY_003313 [Aphis glycines]